jgi:hypothetical protein
MGRGMANLELRYVDEYRDRTGKLRRYFRKGGKRLGVLPGEVGSEEFMTAYASVSGREAEAARKALLADSLAKLIVEYYGSRPYWISKPSSRQLYRYALDPLSKEHGHRSVSQMTPEAD